MLEPFARDIWICSGPTVTAAAGFHYPTRMVIIRLSKGDLVVWSPVALGHGLGEAVTDFGPVRWIIAPNSLHDTFLADWQARFPEAAVLAPPELPEKRRDIAFAGNLPEDVPDDWIGEIELVLVGGNRITTEAVLFHRPSGTAIFCDLLQQFPPGWFRGWRALVARLDLMTGEEPRVPRKFRLAFTDRQAAREAIERVLPWPAERVLVAHGSPVLKDGQAFLARAFAWLMRA
jgi:hypothetical protein